MTTENSGDRGIVIGGSARVTGQVASGDHVSQHQVTHNQQVNAIAADVAAVLDRIERLLEEHAAALAEGERARRDLEDVRRELAEPDPDEERIANALERLGRRVAGVAVLAEAVRLLIDTLGLG